MPYSQVSLFALFRSHLAFTPFGGNQTGRPEDHHEDKNETKEQFLIFGRIKLGRQILPGEINDWKNAFVQKGDKQLLVKRTSLDAGSVKDLVFQLKKEIPNSVTIIISDAGEKPMITVGISADLEAKYHAGNIVKELAKEIQGGGGGNPGFATAGGKNLAGIENALNKAMEI